MTLYDRARHHARLRPEALAISGPDGDLTYGELDRLSAQWAGSLSAAGIRKGDRVIYHAPKSARGLAVLQAILRTGAIYVPVDPLTPASRLDRICRDCQPALVLTDPAQLPDAPPQAEPIPVAPSDPAYILYTSGSTGEPKGVCLSHENAQAFVRWVVDTIRPTPEDRFANHAPWTFDLSVLDLYVALDTGASVHLIPETLSFDAPALNRFLVDRSITVWYSVPSVLQLMLADAPTEVPLRVLFFAGESFPIRQLRALRDRWPAVRFWNLYGPTETNVCTAHEVVAIEPDREAPVPIGGATCGDRVWAETASGAIAQPGEEGELLVEGPTVMLGYWGKQPRPSASYRTGDWVRRLDENNFQYLGRIDNMVKLRGYRVELGAIEDALATHPRLERAVVIVEGEGLDARLVAYVTGVDCPGLLELKRHCAERLPRYMVPDRVRPVANLPLNPNGKVDRKLLIASAAHA